MMMMMSGQGQLPLLQGEGAPAHHRPAVDDSVAPLVTEQEVVIHPFFVGPWELGDRIETGCELTLENSAAARRIDRLPREPLLTTALFASQACDAPPCETRQNKDDPRRGGSTIQQRAAQTKDSAPATTEPFDFASRIDGKLQRMTPQQNGKVEREVSDLFWKDSFNVEFCRIEG